jgi:nucleoid-associated protein YgaU
LARLPHKTPLLVFSAPAALAAGLVAYFALHQAPETMPFAAVASVVPSFAEVVVAEPQHVEAAEVPQPTMTMAPAPTPETMAPAPTPESVTSAVTPAPPPVEIPHIVIKPGNSLWALSRELYGAGRYYATLLNANKDKIDDPKLIYPGQVLTAPKQMDN